MDNSKIIQQAEDGDLEAIALLLVETTNSPDSELREFRYLVQKGFEEEGCILDGSTLIDPTGTVLILDGAVVA